MLGQQGFLVDFAFIIPYHDIARHHERFKSRPTPRQTSRPKLNRFDDEGADDDGSETEGSLFEWEEEATLLSELMEEE